MSDGLAYAAAAVIAVWGAAHVVPTSRIVRAFEPIATDNRRMLVQEWLAEAVTMWGLAALVITVTAVGAGSNVTHWVYRVVAGILVVLATLTASTGARTVIVWFKICVVLLVGAGVLLVAASLT